jgi:hypothetical protein
VSKLLASVRRIVRFLAATVIWLHALAVLSLPRPSIREWAASVHLNVYEASIIFLLALLSILWSYGIRRFALDLAYIYFFPFILLYYLARIGFLIIRFVTGLFWPNEPTAEEQVKPLDVTSPTPAQPLSIGKNKEGKRLTWKSVWLNVSRPLRQFTLLWCLLLLLSSNSWLIQVALAIVVFHLFRALGRILLATVFSISWLAQLEEKVKKYGERLILRVLAGPKDAEIEKDTELRNAVVSLNALRLGVEVLKNRKRVTQGVLALGLLVFLGVYLYLSVLFAFAYYGVARVLSVPYTWGEAFVTSVFIPIMVGELPHNIWLKTLGGIHAVFVILLGLGTVIGYLQKKLDSLREAAETLGTQLEKDEVKRTVQELSAKLKIVPTSLPSVLK